MAKKLARVSTEARRGFYKEMLSVFADARSMVGGTFPPEERADERARLYALEKEALLRLRTLSKVLRRARRSGRASTG